MGTYGLEGVLAAWKAESLTTEQAVGQTLLLLQELEKRVAALERVTLWPAAATSTVSPAAVTPPSAPVEPAPPVPQPAAAGHQSTPVESAAPAPQPATAGQRNAPVKSAARARKRRRRKAARRV